MVMEIIYHNNELSVDKVYPRGVSGIMEGFWNNSFLCTIEKAADYEVVIVIKKNPYLYILSNMSLNLNGWTAYSK